MGLWFGLLAHADIQSGIRKTGETLKLVGNDAGARREIAECAWDDFGGRALRIGRHFVSKLADKLVDLLWAEVDWSVLKIAGAVILVEECSSSSGKLVLGLREMIDNGIMDAKNKLKLLNHGTNKSVEPEL